MGKEMFKTRSDNLLAEAQGNAGLGRIRTPENRIPVRRG